MGTLANVNRLNLLDLAPGGHLGRFVIWTQGAFEALDGIFGSYGKPSSVKSSFSLPRPIMANSDVSRLINSDEVQAVVRPQKKNGRQPQRRNPLVNLGAMLKLNPHAKADLRAADSKKRKASSLAPGSTAVKKQ